VDHPLRLDPAVSLRSWRTATIVVAGIAALELALLVMLAGALVAKPEHPGRKATPARSTTAPAKHRPAAAHTATAKAKAKPQPARKPKPVPAKTAAAAELPRRKVTVVVLNGNGRQGAAAAAASRVSRRGYRIGLVANAPSHDYATSLVMYRPGFRGEARRLARDLGVRVVSPLDGVRPAQLHGAQAVLILGG